MRTLVFLFIIMSCDPIKQLKPEVGDCVIGTRMDVWKLLRKENEKYMFVTYPYGSDSPVEVVKDVSAFKKVDCPL